MMTEQEMQRQIAIDIAEIRALASQITSYAQFEAIIGAVVDPAMREQVRDLIKPLLTFTLPEDDGVHEG